MSLGAPNQRRRDGMPPESLERVFNHFDEINRQDPRKAEFDGQSYPREYLHSKKLHEWVLKLDPHALAPLQLASRCNALRRWEIARDTYPRTTAGYHAWRKALRKFHADAAEPILREEGFEMEIIQKVRSLILMEHFPQDHDAQILEDAECLTFLEVKFKEYLGAWDETKTVRILKGTLKKMSPSARSIAMELPLPPAARALIQKALSS